MNIVVKFPTRSRPHQAISTITGYKMFARDQSIRYVVSIDENDPQMNNGIVKRRLEEMGCEVLVGNSISKVHAINRDLQHAGNWDIMLLGCDDMICQTPHWDDIIRSEFSQDFPDLDGVLWHSDGYVNERLNTLPILGRKYFDRFGYIYNPAYTSLWCDNEFMEVATALGKHKYYPKVLFKHEHFSNNKFIGQDALMRHNESFYQSDKRVYEQRKSTNFGL
jgi:hypothetical protein